MISKLIGQRRDSQTVEIALTKAETLAAAVSKLQELVRQLQAENRKLRRLTHLRPHVRVVRKAHETALKLAALHLAGWRTGRRAATATGEVSERNFFYARAMLELAGLYAGGQIVSDDPEQIENNLIAAAKSAERDFHLLWRRLPPSRRWKV